MTVDERTNSIVIGGSRGDLDAIEAIISRLEDSDTQQRMNEVYVLRNSVAADVAEALNSFFSTNLNVLQGTNQQTGYQQLTRQVVVVAEPISNKLMISATPQWFGEIMKLIMELDAEQAQVAIQVLIAEVRLTGTEEFGMELGLQSPVLFRRGVYPGTTNLAAGTGGQVATGVTVNNTTPVGYPGYNFANPLLPMGANAVADPGVVGFQGINSLGTGRTSTFNNQVGGFVFSGAADSFNLLIRALKTQSRIDVLSRPQVTTLDNQQARVFVGMDYPLVLGSNVTATGVVSNNISYRPIGIEMIVTPKITPDNRVIMRLAPSVSRARTLPNVSLGSGVTATAIDQETVETTVVAMDNETVALGGMITRLDEKNENKIPWFGDLPVVGSAFRFRNQRKEKNELIIVMTPHIVRNKWDAARVLVEESRRMDWVLGEVAKIHGSQGPNPLFPSPLNSDNVDGNMPALRLPPAGGEVAPLPVPKPLAPTVPGASAPELNLPANPAIPAAPGVGGPVSALDQASAIRSSETHEAMNPKMPANSRNGAKALVLPGLTRAPQGIMTTQGQYTNHTAVNGKPSSSVLAPRNGGVINQAQYSNQPNR